MKWIKDRKLRNRAENLVIITATIAPYAGVPFLQLRNVKERAEQYSAGLYALLKARLVDRIVFCDNSNTKLFDQASIADAARLAGKKIEFLTF